MGFRKAKKSDINEMCKIISNTFSAEDGNLAKKEINEMFSKSINKPIYIVLTKNNEIIALIGYIQSWFSYDSYEIFWVAVRLDFQNKGIGKKIINNVISRIRIKERISNKNTNVILSTKAVGFFNKCGFSIVSKPLNKNNSTLMIKVI